ncbi:MAG: gliding motility-associated C-terminal domain-containing protein [Bacteroidales bacterium]
MKIIFFIITFIFMLFCSVKAQIMLSTTTQINTVCNGNPCNYSGPSILINEVMLSPTVGDGSIYGQVAGTGCEGEWIELYNPDICLSVDISCFFLGNNAKDTTQNNSGGGIVIPSGTIVPPRGFVIIRGVKAQAVPSNLLIQNGGNTIEIVLNASLSNRICLNNGQRLWFPNAGGWFAFYDNNGIPQDAISWFNQTNSCMSCPPCNPQVTSCGYLGSLASYNAIPSTKKNYITTLDPNTFLGQSLRRIPDGGNWVSTSATPTYGNCNTTCNPPPNITCNGMAVVIPSGGQAPYTYLWNDQQATTNDTVIGLCAGNYTVMVKDANNNIATATVHIDNLELTSNITTTNISCIGGNNGSATIFANNGTSPYNYLWYNGNTTSTINNLIAGNYTFTITDAKGCKVDSNVLIPNSTVVSTVTINDTSICSRNSVILLAIPSLAGGTYKWLPGSEQTPSIKVSPLFTSKYSLIYTFASCVAKDTAIVTVKQTPIAHISASSNIITSDDSVVISVTGGLSYLWENGSTSNPVIMKPLNDTIYCVVASNNNDCFDTACIQIEVRGVSTLYVPNAFTPNDDGKNDVFLIPYNNVDLFHLAIFSRWGNLLFETNDINVGWDGKYCGEFVTEGIYVYSLEAIGEDKVTYRKLGTITILR